MAGSLRGHSGEQFWKHGWGMVKSLSSVQANAWLFKEVQSSCYKYQSIWMQAVFVFCCFCNKLPRNLSLKGTQMYYLGALEARSPKASTGLHSFWGSGENLPGPLPASRDCADFPAHSPPPSSKPLAWYPFSSLTSTFILTSPSDLTPAILLWGPMWWCWARPIAQGDLPSRDSSSHLQVPFSIWGDIFLRSRE